MKESEQRLGYGQVEFPE